MNVLLVVDSCNKDHLLNVDHIVSIKLCKFDAKQWFMVSLTNDNTVDCPAERNAPLNDMARVNGALFSRLVWEDFDGQG